jgi:hypothetical protein
MEQQQQQQQQQQQVHWVCQPFGYLQPLPFSLHIEQFLRCAERRG